MSNGATPSGKTQSLQDKKNAVTRTAQISWTLREQIRASLPTSDEQFLTVMVPGKVINFEDYISKVTTGEDTKAIKDINVQVREAMLVNDLPATSGVQLGPTGRSISNSYAAALDLLVPSGSTVGVERPSRPNDPNDPQTRFQTAMDWLSTPNNNGDSRIDLYAKYQSAHTAILQERASAYASALEESRKLYPTLKDKQNEYYMEWIQQHYKAFNDKVQAAYMQWVVHGEKEKVEYNFALVDISSANERIEQSKQSMRDSSIATSDGAAEFNRVYLEPSNWAYIAKKKADETLEPALRTPDEIQFDINRLKFRQVAMNATRALGNVTMSTDAFPDEEAALSGAITDTLTKAQAYDEAHKDVIKASGKSAGSLPLASDKKALDDLAQSRTALLAAQEAYTANASAQLRLKIAHQADTLYTTIRGSIDDKMLEVNKRIEDLERELENSLRHSKAAKDPFSEVLEAGRAEDTAPAAPSVNSTLANYWTRITCEVASTYEAQQQRDESTSYSVGGSASWGAFSIGGSYSHSEASGRAASQMSNCSCSVSFDVMRVDITRPWLRAELFYDAGLDAGPSAKLSPGPFWLRMLIDQANEMPTDMKLDPKIKEEALESFSLFPHYSTAFLLAANVVLEMKGETSDIASYFHSEQTAASVSIGWGPFSVSGSYHHSSSDKSSSYETTSDGCRITIKAPQIIGWVSQILPALPRLRVGETPFTVEGWH